MRHTKQEILKHHKTNLGNQEELEKVMKNFIHSLNVTLWVSKFSLARPMKIFVLLNPQSCKLSEPDARRCSIKKLFLEISQNSQENTCARDYFLINLQACNFIKK